jgi:hypothetical protein
MNSTTLSALDLLQLLVENDGDDPAKYIECRLPANSQIFRARFGPSTGWMIEDETTGSRHPNPMKWAMFVRDELLERQRSSQGISVKPYIYYRGKNLRDHEVELRRNKVTKASYNIR